MIRLGSIARGGLRGRSIPGAFLHHPQGVLGDVMEYEPAVITEVRVSSARESKKRAQSRGSK